MRVCVCVRKACAQNSCFVIDMKKMYCKRRRFVLPNGPAKNRNLV